MNTPMTSLPSTSAEAASSQAPAFSVTGGSLPAWSAQLFGLADKWETRARSYHLDADWLKSRDSRRSTEYRDSAIHWQCAANELRTEIVAANVRQPEENR